MERETARCWTNPAPCPNGAVALLFDMHYPRTPPSIRQHAFPALVQAAFTSGTMLFDVNGDAPAWRTFGLV